MILWPCILKLDGDDELIYLNSEPDFTSECIELIFTENDYVIDSLGCTYLIESPSTRLELINTNKVLLTPEVSDLIRRHEFKKASLCLTKIHFLTVSAAIKSLSH
ncbi:DUF4144 family protein [Colwellia sp. 12G3]|uniref:DUF4144 family protein n=1 Tax=Colwellia sp. 12G3 TaxID=2058299 RepID=UPI000C31C8C1|nr:DUF4144 family protein [Colwellia sp. 12G3]PKI17990.1 hypothetical protein CXF71_00860 [Colwellia sp. 12G3]